MSDEKGEKSVSNRGRDDEDGRVDGSDGSRQLELNDLPVELLQQIFVQAAVASVRDVTDEDAQIESVLTSLADVCRLWSAIINNVDAGGSSYSRSKFWQKLLLIDPAFRYRSSTNFRDANLLDTDDVINSIDHIALLGDELFATCQCFEPGKFVVHAWNVGGDQLNLCISSQLQFVEKVYRCIQLNDTVCKLVLYKKIHGFQACKANSSLYLDVSYTDDRDIYGSYDDDDDDDNYNFTIVRLRSTDGLVLAKWTVPYHDTTITVAPGSGSVIIADNLKYRLVIYDKDGQLLRYLSVKATENHSLVCGLMTESAPGQHGLTDDSATRYFTVERDGLWYCLTRFELVEGCPLNNATDRDAGTRKTFSRKLEYACPSCPDGLGHLLAPDFERDCFEGGSLRSQLCVLDAVDFRRRRVVAIEGLSDELCVESQCIDLRRGRLFALLEGHSGRHVDQKMLVYADIWRTAADIGR